MCLIPILVCIGWYSWLPWCVWSLSLPVLVGIVGCYDVSDSWLDKLSPVLACIGWYSWLLWCVWARAGNSLISFMSESLIFCKKLANEWLAKKTEWFAHSLIFGEQPERIAHGCLFLVSDLSKLLKVAHFLWATWALSLTSLIKKEGMSETLI